MSDKGKGENGGDLGSGTDKGPSDASGTNGKRAPYKYTASEKEWLESEREKGGPWEDTTKKFHEDFPEKADVTTKHLSAVYSRVRHAKQPQEAPESILQKRVCMDLEILRIYQEFPTASRGDKAKRLWQTPTYKAISASQTSGMCAETFQLRYQWLHCCGITEEKLRHFVAQVRMAANPYENAPTFQQFQKSKSKTTEQSQRSSNNVMSSTEEKDDDEAEADKAGDGQHNELEMLDEIFSIPEVCELMALGDDEEESSIQSAQSGF